MFGGAGRPFCGSPDQIDSARVCQDFARAAIGLTRTNNESLLRVKFSPLCLPGSRRFELDGAMLTREERVVSETLEKPQSHAETKLGRLVVICSPKGGTGKTSLARISLWQQVRRIYRPPA